MISISASGEVMLRNTFVLEFRIYQKKKSLEEPRFWRKSSIFAFSFQYQN